MTNELAAHIGNITARLMMDADECIIV